MEADHPSHTPYTSIEIHDFLLVHASLGEGNCHQVGAFRGAPDTQIDPRPFPPRVVKLDGANSSKERKHVSSFHHFVVSLNIQRVTLYDNSISPGIPADKLIYSHTKSDVQLKARSCLYSGSVRSTYSTSFLAQHRRRARNTAKVHGPTNVILNS